MTDGLNSVNDIEEQRNWLILRLWAIVYNGCLSVCGRIHTCCFGIWKYDPQPCIRLFPDFKVDCRSYRLFQRFYFAWHAVCFF